MSVRSRDDEDSLYDRIVAKKACADLVPTKGIELTVKLIERLVDAEFITTKGLRLIIPLFEDHLYREVTILSNHSDAWWRDVCVWLEQNDCDTPEQENEVVEFLMVEWKKQHPKFGIEYKDGTLIISA